MSNFPKRGDIFWVNLDPTIGSETQKTRPCVILSNNAQNKKSLRVIIAPITSKVKMVYPFEARVKIHNKEGKAMLDQVKAVDKQRLGDKVVELDFETLLEIEKALKIALALK